jgi:quinol monooxygenase YgiN
MTSRSSKQLVNVLIKIIIKKYKKEEFLESMRMYLEEIRKQPGCLHYELYQDSDKENSYLMVGEWRSAKAMEKHFQTREYELSLGAAKVLCNTFKIETSEVLHIGNHDWARQQIWPRKNTGESTTQ